MSDITLNLTYCDWQKEVFFNNDAKFTTIEKGRRVGFRKGIANACIEWLCDGKKILWVDTITSNLQRYFERYFLPELKQLPQELWKFHSQDKRLVFNEAFLDMRSAERPENIEGFGYDIVILNEAGIILKNAYLWDNAIRPMLLDYPDSRAFIGGVPKGKNKFFELAQKGMRNEKDWKNYQISSYKNPMLRPDEIDELIAELGGADSDVVKQEIYGEFLDSTTNKLFSLSMIENAFLKPMRFEPNTIEVWGLDVARDGDDESVLCKRDGECVKEFKSYHITSTTELAREILREYEMSEKKPEVIFIDTVGVGAGTYDRLVEYGLRGICREAKASYKATDEKRYANKRAEMYFRLKDKIPLLAITPNEKIKRQLQMIEFLYDTKERYLLAPKDAIKKEFGVSPDYADSLALTYFDNVYPRKEQEMDFYNENVW
ncbi:terminase large subunit domain-containing protein [Campylobacter pinnipediorum]|uniref:terminase large subunit domain-containing protein n=1 Tax=Campylobacter pinnipediorum TaxID=1965231 RepID=UPI0009956BB9|nr:terminase family protein [Campylobacter pinnipediorum]AQW83003.1 terminase domain protein [Campylobacter pinnipediorum subsp. pinnipediorum]